MKKLGAGSFQLEPDGFSIHTLEIVKKLSNKEYKRIRDSIYQKCPKGEMYSDRGWQGEGERYRCKWFWREGLRINLEKNVHKQVSTCYLRIAVNPRKLIDPSSSYTLLTEPLFAGALDSSNRDITITACNNAGFALPFTGGTGFTTYILFAALALMAGVCFCKKIEMKENTK